MDYERLAKDILEYVGTDKNVNSVTNCATRLRFCLKDESLAKEDKLKELEPVAGILKKGGQFQIVVGLEAADLCKEVKKIIT